MVPSIVPFGPVTLAAHFWGVGGYQGSTYNLVLATQALVLTKSLAPMALSLWNCDSTEPPAARVHDRGNFTCGQLGSKEKEVGLESLDSLCENSP